MRDKVSVAMATYNGEKYIKEQIDSILANLEINDELIISDDGSTDNTINIIKSYKDNRIILLNGPRKGVKKNFENAIRACKGKYVFLSDQDDVWECNKIDEVLKAFQENDCTLVIHDAEVVDDKLQTINESFFEYRKCGAGILKNIYKNTYIGCCMAFDRNITENILPIPDDVEMHDQWIGVVNEIRYTKSLFLNKKLIKYRRHNNNTSKLEHYGFVRMIKNRVILIKRLIKNVLLKK